MNILTISFFLLAATSHAEQDSTKRQAAIQFNNRASEVSRNGILQNNQSLIQSAIQLLDSAIAVDSSYTIAYTNKASLLCHASRKHEAIQALEAMLTHAPGYGDGHQLLGIIYESAEMKQKAFDSYRRSVAIYQQQMDKNPETALASIIASSWLLEEVAAVDSLLTVFTKRFPKSKHLENISELVANTDKLEYVNSICK